MTTCMRTGMHAAIAALTIVVGVAAWARPASAQDVPSAEQVASGDAIFHGRSAGAVCYTCHGQNGKGVAGLGPDLTDATWLHGDGSLEFLARIVTSGVTKPKKSALVMPPFGGATLTPEQVRAVAAYVHSLRKAK